jgi:hypothetical protein
LSLFLIALPVQAQFLIGSPSKTQLQSASGWTVELNRTDENDQRIQTALLTQDLLAIRLFDNLSVTARKANLRHTDSGGIYWTGKVEGTERGELTLFMQNHYLTGTLRLGDKVIDLSPGENGTLQAVEIDLPDCPIDEDCYHQEENAEPAAELYLKQSPAELRATPTTDPEGHYIIDILVLYPTEVANQMGSTATARTAKVTQYIEEANEIFDNSEINIRFRLAHDEINDDINKNATSAGDVRLATITTMQEKYGADIVSHWNYKGSAGTAYNYGGDASASGYNTSQYALVVSQYTFVHECGHNIGAKHDRYDYRDQSDLAEPPYYNFGKVFPNYRTVMAYSNCKTVGGTGSCNRIKHFTNPNVLYNGVPTGVEGEEASTLIDGGPADNAKRLNLLAEAVSGCKEPVTTLPTFRLTVVNGTPAESNVIANTIVTITANAAPSGQVFSHWSWVGRASGIIDDLNQETANVYMLSKNISIQANYKTGNSSGIESPNDAIVATQYYNLQGIEVVPEVAGIYIVKNSYASGHTITSKVVVPKKM